MPITSDEVERALPRVRGRHRAAPADGVRGEGRRASAARARPRRRGGGASAPSRARRRVRRSSRSNPARTRRARSWSSAGAERTCARWPPTSAPRSVGARISRSCGGCASARSRFSEARPLADIEAAPDDAVLSLVVAMRDLERVDVDDEQARAVSHGVSFACWRARSCAATVPYALVGPDGTLLAVYDDARRGAAARRRGHGVLSRADRRRPHRALERAHRSGRESGRGRHHRRVRRRAPRPPRGAPPGARARRRARARGGVRDLRSPPGRGRAPGVGAAAADVAGAEARAPRRHRLPRSRLRAALRRGPQPRACRRLRAGGPRRRRARRGSWWWAPTSTSGAPAAATSPCSNGWGPSWGSRCSASGSRPRPGARSTRRPASASCSPRATSTAPPRCSVGRTRCAAPSSRVTGGAGSSGTRRPTSRSPAASASRPTASTRVRSSAPTGWSA